jgi:hypothetical protein
MQMVHLLDTICLLARLVLGPYLQGRFQELADAVNAKLDGGDVPTPTPPPEYNEVVLDYQQSWNKTYGATYGYILEDGLFGSQTEWSKTKVYLKRGMNNHLIGWCQCRLKYHKGYDLGDYGVNHDGVDDSFRRNYRVCCKKFSTRQSDYLLMELLAMTR